MRRQGIEDGEIAGAVQLQTETWSGRSESLIFNGRLKPGAPLARRTLCGYRPGAVCEKNPKLGKNT